MIHQHRWAALACAVVATSVACTAGAGSVRYAVSFDAVTCPPEVAVISVRAISCGYVTVPQDRSHLDGREVRLFVLRIPPATDVTGAPVIYVGGQIGFTLDYSNVNAIARTLRGHELIAVESRGTGHSDPNLSCPEVDALAGRAAARPIDDPSVRAAFVAAVAACRARIVSDGVDPAAFDVPAMGDDIIDVARALGLSSWELLSKGSTSRAVLDAMRSDPAGLLGVVLYNPEFPETDPFAQEIASTRASLDHLVRLCRQAAACRGRAPALQSDISRAVDRLQAAPVRLVGAGSPVWMDGAAFLRSVRAKLSMMPAAVDLPGVLRAVAHARDPTATLEALEQETASSQTFCIGYFPLCPPNLTLDQGAYYSVLCRDEVPFADPSALTLTTEEGEAWALDFVRGPYRDVCASWTVPADGPGVTAPVESDVSVLIEDGEFSTAATGSEIRGGAAGLSNSSIVVSPIHGDGGYFQQPECHDVRLSFLNDPHAPVNARCLAQSRLPFAEG